MKISRYFIYGERHSGTNFLDKLIRSNLGLTLNNELGNKHFFQLSDIYNKDTSDTIVFSICRNPYDWLSALYKIPHHCAFNPKDILSFLSTEWWSREEFLGPEILEDRNWTNQTRYSNILELRYYKLCFLYFLPRLVKHHIHINYEDFLWTPQQTIISNLKKQCKYLDLLDTPHIVQLHKIKNRYKVITPTAFDLINDSLDWDLEFIFGYKKFNTYSEYEAKYSGVDASRSLLYDSKEVSDENAKHQIFQNEYFLYQG